MSMVPSCQIYQTTFLDSFQSSFHGARLQILRYGSSIPFKKHNFYITHSSLGSISNPDKYPQRKSYLVPQKKVENPQLVAEAPILSDGSWIGKWSNTHYLKLPKRPQALVDYRNDEGISSEDDERDGGSSGGGGGSTMERIVEKLKKFGYVDDVCEKKKRLPERGSVEDIFYVEEGRLPNARGGFSEDMPLGETGFEGGGEIRFPWEKPVVNKEELERFSVRRKSKTELAELTLPESEIRRLRNLSMRLKSKIKIGGSGVTQSVVDVIHERWQTSEVVRLRCEGPPALNMKRMHEILERKTGGLVIWRSGTTVSLYRGVSYDVPSTKQAKKQMNPYAKDAYFSRKIATEHNSHGDNKLPQGTSANYDNETNPEPKVNYEDEIDQLLDGLGPRYTDWPGGDPLPVDADLLPGVIPGYEPPFRVLPHGVRSTLGLKESTALRRLSRVLPPHFAIGRSRQHEGLAKAMVKLWERSSIAKVALKRGVQLTTSERMAEDIKRLTGGQILSRNKDFIVFYRGKNFLSPELTVALLEKERMVKDLQDEEEQARLRASSFVTPMEGSETIEEPGTAGTLWETLEADARWGKKLDTDHKERVLRAAEVERHANLVRKLELKLAFSERKLRKAESALAKVEVFLTPAERPLDQESISDEERFMFRKIGLKMKAYLLLGRRGVFDGTVENMHLHWKYRELVKILVKAKSFEHVKKTALALEAESGGILVSVDKVSKGYAIIVFRGREYRRPPMLRPKNLLTKRKALARSIELQRHEALEKHISAMRRRVESLRSELNQMETVKDQGDEELYAKLDSSYSSEEDEDTEDEGGDAYLETYDSGSERDNDIGNSGDIDDSIFSLHSESDISYDDPHDQSWETDHEASTSYASVEPDQPPGPRDLEEKAAPSSNLQLIRMQKKNDVNYIQ